MFDVGPYVLIIIASAFVGVSLSVWSLLVEDNFWWGALYAVFCIGLYLGAARLAHKKAKEREMSSLSRFATEFFVAGAALLPMLVAGMAMLSTVAKFSNAALIVFKQLWVPVLIGSFPLMTKYLWVSRGKQVQANLVNALKESERLQALEQNTDAEEKLRETILAHEMHFGSTHVETARALLHLARMFSRLHEKEKASALIRRALLVFEQVLGPSAPEVADCVLELVKSDPNTDQETVLPLLRRAQVVREQQFGAESQEVAEVCGYLGGAHFRSAKWNDAVEAYRKGLTIFERILPEVSPERIQMSGRLASSYVRAGRPMEAEKLIRAILESRAQLDLPADADYFHLLVDFGQLQHRQNRLDEEKKLIFEALAVLVEHVGPSHPSRDELLQSSAPHLHEELSPGHIAFVALLAADGVALRKVYDGNAAVLQTPDAFGWTLLQWATFLGQDRHIDTLLFAGSVTDLEDTEWPPLQIALRWGHKRAMQALLQKGASSAQVGKGGWTALHRAAQAGDDRIVDSLVAKGAPPNQLNEEGDGPLHIAARNGFTRVVIELVHHGADTKAINEKTGRSPLHEAANRGMKSVVECLVLNSPEVIHQLDQKGRNAAELAALGGHPDLAKFLEQQLKMERKERDKEDKAREKEQLKSKEVPLNG